MKRRTFLKSTGLFAGTPVLLPRLSWAVGNTSNQGNILVTVFLGGGADGLNIVAPVGDNRYFDLRPTLAVQTPGAGPDASLDLDGFYAMHPAMGKLHQRFHNGELAVVQATGLTSDSHSHFDSISFMQRGIVKEQNVSDGWLNRHLSSGQSSESVFHAVGLQDALPRSLSGGYPAISIKSLQGFGLGLPPKQNQQVESLLARLYQGNELLDVEAGKALAAISELRSINPAELSPPNEVSYPDSEFGQHCRDLAQLIKSDIGLGVASLSLGGWDHHDNQAQVLPDKLSDLANSLDAFASDMGSEMNRITIVTMSEFGRRVAENASGGFDHGYGSFMLAMGAGVSGGKVYGDWPGLAQSDLRFSGDLDITTDYRTVLAELLSKRFGQSDIGSVFPGYAIQPELGLFLG